MNPRDTPEWDNEQYDEDDEDEAYMERLIEMSFLSNQLMNDDPTLGALDAHFKAVEMIESLLAYAAEWDTARDAIVVQ